MTRKTESMFSEIQISDYTAQKMERFRKPITMPRPFNWDARHTEPKFPAWAKGLSLAQFCAADPYRDTFAGGRFDDALAQDPYAYVREWERVRGLKPATAWVTPTHGSYA